MRCIYFILLLISIGIYGQVPHGNIYVGLTHLKKDSITVIPERNLIGVVNEHGKMTINVDLFPGLDEQLIYESWKNKDFSRFALLNSLNEKFEDCKVGDTCSEYFRGGSVNFNFINNSYYVTLLKKESDEMFIYIYTTPDSTKLAESSKNHINGEITNIFFKDPHFRKGTYLINLYDSNNPLSKSKAKEHEFNDKLIITSQDLKVAKIDDQAIAPEMLKKYIEQPDRKRPEAIDKILSIFN